MPDINHFLIMGDSLSDRGAMYHRKLFDILPMSVLSGLSGKSSSGRFTDGYTWDDQVLRSLIAGFELKKNDPTKTTEQIKEDIKKNTQEVKDAYKQIDLDDDTFVFDEDTIFARTYCEGGLTAHPWAGRPSYNPARFISRFILSTLEEKRESSTLDDTLGPFSLEQKQKTLIIEWSGANDLITANAEPSAAIADLAIAARISNIQKMMAEGYCNFVLFNLPNLSLTPRYQRLSQRDRENAHHCCEYFNTKLAETCERLKADYPDCNIEVFDINSIFTNNYEKAKAGESPIFAANKLSIPLTETRDCKIEKDGTCPAKGYMFWDDVHPTQAVHAILAIKFYKKFAPIFNFSAPEQLNPKSEQTLRQEFAKTYVERLQFDGTLGFTNSRLTLYNTPEELISLEAILEHALFKGGKRSLEVITDLGWLDGKGKINYMQPALRKTMQALQKKRSGITESSQTAAELVQNFREIYLAETDNIVFFREKRVRLNTQDLTLEKILAHAFHNNGNRTLKIIRNLGWLDHDNNVTLENEALKKAICNFQRKLLNREQKAFCDIQDQHFIEAFKATCESHGIDTSDIDTSNIPTAMQAIQQKISPIVLAKPVQASMDISSVDLNETTAISDRTLTVAPLYQALLKQGWIKADGQPLHPSLVASAATEINHTTLNISP